MSFLSIIEFLSQLLPLAHTAIQEIEPLFPNAHQGAAKADAAIQIASSVLPATGAPDSHIAAAQAALPALVTAITAARAVAASFDSQPEATTA